MVGLRDFRGLADHVEITYDYYREEGPSWSCTAVVHAVSGWVKAASNDPERLIAAVLKTLQAGITPGETDLGAV